MIICDNGNIKIMGSGAVVLAEATAILHTVYEDMVEKLGEEEAKLLFAEMGRAAVMSEEELAKATFEGGLLS